MKDNDKKREHPSKDAFLTNPVASATEFTGYGVRLPLSEEEADSLSEMMEDVPAEKSRMGDAVVNDEKSHGMQK